MDCEACTGPDARWRYWLERRDEDADAEMLVCDPCHQDVQADRLDKIKGRLFAKQGKEVYPISKVFLRHKSAPQLERLYGELRRATARFQWEPLPD